MDATRAIAETDPRLNPRSETPVEEQAARGPLTDQGWASGLWRIEKLVRRAPFDQRALRVRLRPRGSGHEARVVLVLPAETLVGLGEGPTADLAFSDAIDWLAGELRRRAETARAEALEL